MSPVPTIGYVQSFRRAATRRMPGTATERQYLVKKDERLATLIALWVDCTLGLAQHFHNQGQPSWAHL